MKTLEELKTELAAAIEIDNEAWKARSTALLAFRDSEATWASAAKRVRELKEEIDALPKESR